MQPEQLSKYAKDIVLEINHAWAYPENYPKLSQYQMGAKISKIGLPSEWWEENCIAYKEIMQKLSKDDLSRVCQIAEDMIDEIEPSFKE